MATLLFVNMTSGLSLNKLSIHLAVEGLQIPSGYMLSFEDQVNLGSLQGARPREFFEVDDGKVEINYVGTMACIRIECLKPATFLKLRSMVMQRLGYKIISWSPAVETPSLVAVIRGDIVRIRHWMRTQVQWLRQRLSLWLW